MPRPIRILAAGLLAAALPAATATAVLPSADAAVSAPAPSPVVLWAPSSVTVTAYGTSHDVYDPLGVRLNAPDAAFEVRSHRPTYDDPIGTGWTSGASSGSLPPGTMTDFSALPRFYNIKLRRADGSIAYRKTPGACLNGEAGRLGPDSPLRSPYPLGCPTNPYTVGGVMGIQQGWSVGLHDWSQSIRLKPGHYTATASISEPYRTAFGIAATDARVTYELHVTTEGECRAVAGAERGCRPASTTRGRALTPRAQRPSGTSAGAVAGPVMDLRSLPAFGISIGSKGRSLRFGANVWNAGDSPLVIDGFRRSGEDVMDAYQYFFDAEGNETGYQQVGEMHWHAANHNHWHFEDFAQYELLNADLTLAVRSKKQSFCLAATDAVDYTVPGADWHPDNTDLSTACGGQSALSIREVLSSGSGDTYYQYRYGQAFKLDGLPNGVYYLKVTANPQGNLVEADTANNSSLRKVRIGGQGANRWVKPAPVGVIDEGDLLGFRAALGRSLG